MSYIELSIDTTGACCPTPLVETNKAIKELKSGQVLELISTDPATPNDIKSWCERTGNILVSSVFNDAEYKHSFLIKKG